MNIAKSCTSIKKGRRNFTTTSTKSKLESNERTHRLLFVTKFQMHRAVFMVVNFGKMFSQRSMISILSSSI